MARHGAAGGADDVEEFQRRRKAWHRHLVLFFLVIALGVRLAATSAQGGLGFTLGVLVAASGPALFVFVTSLTYLCPACSRVPITLAAVGWAAVLNPTACPHCGATLRAGEPHGEETDESHR